MYMPWLRNIILETFKSVHTQDWLEVKENKYNLRGGTLLDQHKVTTENMESIL